MSVRRIVSAALAATSVSLLAQQKPTFRTEVNYVELHVSVTTKDGQRVHGLTKADFAVKESGTSQTIETVEEVALPLPAPRDPHAFEPDGSVADTGSIDKGRLYVLVIDRGHLDASHAPKLNRQLAEFIDDFVGPSDLVAVVNLGSSSVTPFTANKTRLRAGLGLLNAYRTPADASELKVPEAGGGKDGMVAESIASNIAAFADAAAERDATAAAGSFDSMDALAKYMRGFEGRRKALVYVSGGLDVFAPGPGEKPAVNGSKNAIFNASQRMIASLQANNITVYSIDPNGLATFDPFDGGASGKPLSLKIGPDYLEPVAMLRAIADDTGGFPVVGFNDLTKPFARIVEDNSDYYVIGYSSNRPADGKAHGIDVRVAGGDVEVRTRREIEGASPKAKVNAVDAAWRKTDVVNLLARPVPSADPGLRLRLTASPVTWHRDRAIVGLALEIHEGGLPLSSAPPLFVNDVVVAFQAIDENGLATVARSETVTLRVRPETRDAILNHGWRYETEFEVPRGVYQLRVAASESNTGKSGSAFLDLPVRDASKDPLSVVGLLLAADSARIVPTAAGSPVMLKLKPNIVTGSRAFNTSDTVTAIASVADTIAGDHGVLIAAELTGRDGRVAKAVRETVASRDLRADASPRAIALPLAGVPAGEYQLVLRVEAAGKSASRSLVVQVLR